MIVGWGFSQVAGENPATEAARYPLEKAYGRATVALTRARSLCIIMRSLDMQDYSVQLLSWSGSRVQEAGQFLPAR